MSQIPVENLESLAQVPALTTKLCNHFAKNDKDLAAEYFRIAITFLTSVHQFPPFNSRDEQYVVAQIRKFLLSLEPSNNVQKFDLLYAKFQKTSILRNKCAILLFFLHLASQSQSETLTQWSMLEKVTSQSSINSSKSQTFLPDDNKGSVKKLYSANLGKNLSASSRTQLSQATTVPSIIWSNSDHDLHALKDRCSSIESSRSGTTISVSESQLIQEVIYSFQGIEGKVLRKEPGGLGFTIDGKASKGMTPIQRGLIERLSCVGFLHNQLKQHCDEADKQIGLIGQSLIAILREELTSYYQMVALLQAQSKKQGCYDHSELSLRRMSVWVAEPQMHLQWLAYIAEQCSDKKGGALVSMVHGFLQHGAQCVQKVSEKVLSAVCRPLYLMLSKWLLDGEINDPCGEFFIEARNVSNAERLWYDKYYVRQSMIPSFITVDQANKILATGKSINFLRQICKDSEELPGRDALQKLFAITSAEALFSPEQSIELHTALESVYRETSLRVLNLLKNKFRLLEHLQALRRYLLLGQGDFIRHLLELLAPELNKPAQELYGHTLSGILESAIRVTNAQFEDEDTLQRLNVGLMDPSHGDLGWDTFTLVYIVDGPVGTIFEHTMPIYKCLFGGLWKTKRMEYVLSNMRKQQISCAKLFRRLDVLKPVSHLIHVLASKMINLLHQMQYYFLFEVLECSWAEMLKQVNQAESLDHVIKAHGHFLESVQNGVLLDTTHTEIRTQLGIIFTLILNLETLQDALYTSAESELESILAYERKCASHRNFGTNLQYEYESKERTLKFKHFVSSVKCQVKQLSTKYTEFITRFLTSLSTSPDMNLQLLSVRLNFNDFNQIT
ncbi:gamma-tubulin complex component 3 [Onthophagus taurus]|uniref:gamma-tubulin complex component 3 n=1 Tax=Onthophagus taurus TaxID=166361 RepID=UPI000C20630D|nr:gamma-tubulin complex component 3 [Onthophagus taurus]